ncbi:HNH endonuclease [Mycobacterium antarcticum]|uniref:HNH endonuclease signature motif containing protein n=1 Tax=unclassified Mycolicibacterium TaxID=2636767 RepID=UPI002394D986|nr:MULTISPECIES: HNH endonuclease signature motif containing protein [unclassified Mycolicibacterium]GLP77086.1 HNH endonuclease [Mycolicibacterium sp. TUM20983]GLP82492.1 HNH endonuclease [Mycolicibacterium sp. TUM20984]
MSTDRVLAAVAALRAVHDELDALDFDALSARETVTLLDALEESECRTAAHRHRALAQLQQQSTPTEMGAKSWRDVLAIRWRLSGSEAGRRLTHAAQLGPRRSITGEPLAPTLEAVAVAQRMGFLTHEHVELIRKGMAKIPGWVQPSEREQIEVDWVRHGVGDGPKALKDQIDQTLFLLDQDGQPPNDEERQRRRGARLGPQRHDTMTEFTATMTPAHRAVWEVLFAKFAAPGMCNPADEQPCFSGIPSQAQIDADDRTLAQRQHDAMEFIARHALSKGELGHLNGVPTSILIRTTLADLMTMTGTATTGGGTFMPVTDVVKMAAEHNATNYLGVFDDATGQVLDFYRARRTASVAQRLAIILRDGGCTKPSCPVPAYGTQVHHTVADWNDGGHTNVNDMSLACGPDNRMVGPDGWTTTMNEHHDTEWHPPPQLDTGQNRVNHYHHPERFRTPAEDAWTPDVPAAGDAPTQRVVPPVGPDPPLAA